MPTVKTLSSMAEILAVQGRDSECQAVLEQLIADYPSYTAAYNDLAELYLRSGMVSSALEAIDAGLAVAPDDPVLNNNAGMCYTLQGKYKLAFDRFRKAAGSNPMDARTRANMAMALGMLGRDQESLALYMQIMPEKKALANLETLHAARVKLDLIPDETRVAAGEEPASGPIIAAAEEEAQPAPEPLEASDSGDASGSAEAALVVAAVAASAEAEAAPAIEPTAALDDEEPALLASRTEPELALYDPVESQAEPAAEAAAPARELEPTTEVPAAATSLAPEATAAAELAPEPELAPEAAPEPELAPEAAPEPELAPEAASEPELAPEAASEPELAPEAASEPELAPVRELAPEPEPALPAEPGPARMLEPTPEPEPEAETEAETEAAAPAANSADPELVATDAGGSGTELAAAGGAMPEAPTRAERRALEQLNALKQFELARSNNFESAARPRPAPADAAAAAAPAEQQAADSATGALEEQTAPATEEAGDDTEQSPDSAQQASTGTWRGLDPEQLVRYGAIQVQRPDGVDLRLVGSSRMKVCVNTATRGAIWVFGPENDLRLHHGAIVEFDYSGNYTRLAGQVDVFSKNQVAVLTEQ